MPKRAIQSSQCPNQVPEDYRAEFPIQWADDGRETGHRLAPVGRYLHEAADRIEDVASFELE